MLHRMLRLGLVGALAVSVVGSATAASARGARAERRGSCSASSEWKLKADPDDGRLQIEYEVETQRGGQTWRVKLFHDGDRFLRANRTTGAASHSFTIRAFEPDRSGTDTISARARNRSTGEVCGGRVSI